MYLSHFLSSLVFFVGKYIIPEGFDFGSFEFTPLYRRYLLSRIFSIWKASSVQLNVSFAPSFSEDEMKGLSDGATKIIEDAFNGDYKIALAETAMLAVVWGFKYVKASGWFESAEKRMTRQKGIVNKTYADAFDRIMQECNVQMKKIDRMLDEKKLDVLQTYSDPQLIMDEVIFSMRNITIFLQGIKEKIGKEIRDESK